MSDEPWADLLPPDLTGHDTLLHEAPAPEPLEPEPANRQERRAAGERGPRSHRGHVVAGTGLAAAIATLTVASVFGGPIALLALGGAAAAGGVGAGVVAARRGLAKRRASASLAGRTRPNRHLRRAARQFGSALRTANRTGRTGARTLGRTGTAKSNRTRFGSGSGSVRKPKLGSNSRRTRFGSAAKPNQTARTGFGSVGRTGGKKSSGSVRPRFGSAGRGSMKPRGSMKHLGPQAAGSKRRGPVGALRSRMANRKAGLTGGRSRSGPVSRSMRKATGGLRRAAQRLSPTRLAQSRHRRHLRREQRAKNPATVSGRRAMRKVAKIQQRTARATQRSNDVIKRRSDKRQRRWEKRDQRHEQRLKRRKKSRKRWAKRVRRALAYRPRWFRQLRETSWRSLGSRLGASLLNLIKQVPGWVWAPKVKTPEPAARALSKPAAPLPKAKPAREPRHVDNVMPKPVKRVNISKPRMTTRGMGNMHANIEAIVEEFQRGIAGYELPDSHAVPDVNDFLESFSGMFSQMGDAIVSLGEKWDSDEPIEHPVAEFMKEVGGAIANMGNDADEVYETWRNEHKADIDRFENPRNGEEKMNV